MKALIAKLVVFLIICTALPAALPAAAVALPGSGKIVASHDEWPVSNTGFTNAPDAGAFARNVAAWFTGGGPGTFLIYSNNFAFDTSFKSTLQAQGHTVVHSMAQPFSLATLQQYDGVFLAGNPVDNNVLISYVQAGGNVYVAGGTGWHVPEQNLWNPFLQTFGLSMGPSYNGVCCTLPVTNTHSLMSGVNSLYHWNGNSISANPAVPGARVITTHGAHGLIGVYDGGCTPGNTLGWRGALQTQPYSLSASGTLQIRFTYGSCTGFVRDESVIIMVTDAANPGMPVTAWVYGWEIEIDDAAGEYRQVFVPGLYGLGPGANLIVEVYMADGLVGTAPVNIVP